jgi:hypothetical protein
MADEFRLLRERIERLEPAVGDVRDRLRHCLRVADRPQDALALARCLAESLAKRMAEGIGLRPPAMLDGCLHELERPEVMSRGLVPSEIITILHMVRVLGNKAAHDSMRIDPTGADVSLVLQSLLRAVEWYFTAFERGPRLERLFAPPGAADERPRDAETESRVAGTAFSTRRKAAYEELWRRIEEIHLKIRSEEIGDAAFSALLRGMNTFIFQNSAYLDEALHDLANTYLLLLLDVRRVLEEAGDEEATRAFADTEPIPVSALGHAREMRDLVERAEGVRADLLRRVRAVLDEKSSEVPKRRRWWKFW